MWRNDRDFVANWPDILQGSYLPFSPRSRSFPMLTTLSRLSGVSIDTWGGWFSSVVLCRAASNVALSWSRSSRSWRDFCSSSARRCLRNKQGKIKDKSKSQWQPRKPWLHSWEFPTDNHHFAGCKPPRQRGRTLKFNWRLTVVSPTARNYTPYEVQS